MYLPTNSNYCSYLKQNPSVLWLLPDCIINLSIYFMLNSKFTTYPRISSLLTEEKSVHECTCEKEKRERGEIQIETDAEQQCRRASLTSTLSNSYRSLNCLCKWMRWNKIFAQITFKSLIISGYSFYYFIRDFEVLRVAN